MTLTTNPKTGRQVLAINIGDQFGCWTVISEAVIRGGKRSLHCRCKCGVERCIRVSVLNRGKSQGCQTCRMREVHFETHGMSRTPTFSSWKAMIDRCYDDRHPMFHRYGGRGISVCDAWRNSPEQFAADMGLRPAGMTRLLAAHHQFPESARNTNAQPSITNGRTASRIGNTKQAASQTPIEYWSPSCCSSWDMNHLEGAKLRLLLHKVLFKLAAGAVAADWSAHRKR